MTKARDLASSGVTLTSTTTTADAALARAGGTMTGDLAMGTNLVDGVDVSARDAVLTDTTTKATAALPKTGGAMTGAITTNSTFDGVDIATRDAVLSSTTTTATNALNNANNALPKEGGVMTGPITTNSTFDGVDVGVRDSVLTSTTTTANAALPKAGGTMTGDLTTTGLTVTGDDIILDSSSQAFLKLDKGASSNFSLTRHYTAGTENWRTGTYDDGTNYVIGTPSAKKLSITTGGDVGIGVSDPDSTLDISGGSNKLGILRVTQRASGASAYGLDVGLDPSTGDPVFSRIVNDTVTEAFRIQRSSGNVGIGTSSPAVPLDVIGAVQASGRYLTASGAVTSGYQFSGDGDTGMFQPLANNIGFSTGNAERMRLLANGDLRFGAGNSSSPLIQGTTNSGRTAGSPGYSFNDDINTGMFQPQSTTDTIAFSTGGTERMRINASGNLLVGKSSSNSDANGVELLPTGTVYITANNTLPFYINRRGTSGNNEFARFSDDGATRGTIASSFDNELTISASGTNSSGILFSQSNQVRPMKNGATSNGTQDLGANNGKWKDLYLSGGVFLGGTGAANKLEDYEEGTWTPNVSSGGSSITVDASNCVYTKIGRLVTCSVEIYNLVSPTSAVFQISGLPFQTGGGYEGAQPLMYHSIQIPSGRSQLNIYTPSGQNYFRVYASGNNIAWVSLVGNNLGTTCYIIATFSYQASS